VSIDPSDVVMTEGGLDGVQVGKRSTWSADALGCPFMNRSSLVPLVGCGISAHDALDRSQ
jgi:hypothetical protein